MDDNLMHTVCLLCGKPAVSVPFGLDGLPYANYSYCKDCIRQGIKLLKRTASERQEFMKASEKPVDLFAEGGGGVEKELIVEIVKAALDKGGQHIMVDPDGGLSIWPDAGDEAVSECRWYNEITGICDNDACPACAEKCRCIEHVEICRYAEEPEEGTYD